VTTSAPITPLTPALRRVAQHLANGLTPEEIVTETGLSAATVRQYIRDLRECLHCPRRCKPPVLVHRLLTAQQVAPPPTDRPAPTLGPEQLRLLRAVAEHSDARSIAVAAKLAPADLRSALDQLIGETGTQDTTQLVIRAHSWKLLAAGPVHATRSGANR
jgi:DNA-binding NarL/FixJ family response regulator